MKVSIYHRRRFHSDVIKRVIWLYFRFNLSLREIEELMAERGVDVSYETIRRWIEHFGPAFAKRLKTRSPNPSTVWHLDEVYTKINGKMVYLWRAVDDEGTVLDIVVQSRRNKKAAMRLLRKLLKNNGIKPDRIVTDRLSSYRAALKELNMRRVHVTRPYKARGTSIKLGLNRSTTMYFFILIVLTVTSNHLYWILSVSYTHLRAPRDRTRSRMPSSA